MDKVDQGDYKKILTEIIQSQMKILGAEMAINEARKVGGITVGDDGVVTHASGPEQGALERLVAEYAKFSGKMIKTTVSSIFEKYHISQN